MRIKKTIKEKCLSALIVTCMVLGLVHTEFGTVNVKAAEVTVDSEEDFGNIDGVDYVLNSYNTVKVIQVSSGTYTLTTDVTLSKPLYIAAGDTVTIILDGYKIDRGFEGASSGTKDGMVIINDGTLTLGSPTQTGGTITGGYASLTNFAGGVNVGIGSDSAKLTNYVNITGNKGATAGGVYTANDAVFYNYGTISYNKGGTYGGGVNSDYTSEFINYGTINNNKASNHGGGVIVGWEATVKNYGIISDNEAGTNGGGVDVSGKFAIFENYGNITNNKASVGGGVNISVERSGYGAWLLDNTVITGNVATSCGGGVCGDGILYMSGKVIITGNKRGSIDSTKTDNLLVAMGTSSFPGILIQFEGELLEGSRIGVNGTTYSDGDTGKAGVISNGYLTGVPSGELKYFVKDSIQDSSNYHVLFVNQSNELEFVLHEHDWIGQADGNIIKMCCKEDSAKCEYYGADIESATKVLTFTLNASDMNYNGSSYNGASTEWDVTGVYNPHIEIKYEGVSTIYDNITTPPVNAGTYKATVTISDVTDMETQAKGITAEEEFTISPANQPSNITVNMSDYVYNQSEALPTPSINGTVNGGATVKYYYNTSESTSGGAEWKDIDSTSLPVGTYYMYAVIEATNNYKERVTDAVPFDVQAANMTGITVENVEVTYDGEYHGIDITGVPQGATIKYGTSEGTYTLDECPTYKDASSDAYAIYYQVTLPGYNTYTGSATVKITPAVVDIIWGNTTFAYDGQPHLPEANVTGVVTGDSSPITITGEATDVGTGYEAEAVSTNSNYKVNDAHKYVTFEITKGVQNAPQIEGVDETVLGVEDGKIIGLTTSMEYRLEGETEYVPVTSVDMVFAPGKYYVRYSETANYNSSDDMVIVIEEGPENTPPVIKGIEDGKTYCHDVEFSVEDNNIDKIYIDGREITLTNGKYTISVEDIMANPGAADSETHVVRIVETTQEVTEFTITVTATHEYEEPEFSWSEDNSSVTVTSKCVHDDKHVVTVTEETDVEIIQQATETVDGKVEYTVTVVIAGVQYTKKKVVEKSINDEIFSNVEGSKDNESNKDDEGSKGNESNKDDEGSKGNESNKDDENSKDNGASKDNQSLTGNSQGSVPGLGDSSSFGRFVMYAVLMAMIVCVGMLKSRNKETE